LGGEVESPCSVTDLLRPDRGSFSFLYAVNSDSQAIPVIARKSLVSCFRSYKRMAVVRSVGTHYLKFSKRGGISI